MATECGINTVNPQGFFVQRQLPVLLALNAVIPTLPSSIVNNGNELFNGGRKYTDSEMDFMLWKQSVFQKGYISFISS